MRKKIIETIQETLNLRSDQIKETTQLEEIAKDSMDIVELVAVLSGKYKVAIEPEKMGHIKTICDLIDYIIQNKGSSKSALPIESF
jgi:acyl carrier protein